MAASVAVIGLTLLLCWLGFWQLGRARDKEERLHLFEERLQAPIVHINQLPADQWYQVDHMFWRRVRLDGRYPAELPYLYLDNQVYKGSVGYNVYRLFHLRAGDYVPVFLGWRPVGSNRSIWPEPPSVSEELLTLSVTLVAPPAAGLLLQPWRAEKKVSAGQAIWRLPSFSVDNLATAVRRDILPYVARPIAEGAAAVQPFGGLPPERHRGYAFQWFSLAILCPLFFIGVKKWAA